MDNKELQEILRLHKLWLAGSLDGKCANLWNANLWNANLRGADLRNANLRGADLRGADLRGTDLRGSDLQYADLWGANLRYTDLRGADLRGANLRDAKLDYSCWPLWCGSLDAHIDDRIARQLLYHLIRPCLVSPDVSEDFKRALFTPELIAEANAFHRVEECGKIVSPYEEDDHGQSN